MSKLVFKGKTTDGIPYIIRYPKRTDLHELWRYINEISKEQTFISLQGEEISLEEERVFLNRELRKIKENKGLLLIVETNKKIIGVSHINRGVRISSHIGTFGISIAKDFRGKGIGKKLIKTIIAESKKLAGIKIIELECFASNDAACKLYKSCGFKEYGRLPGGLSHKGSYVDDILMYYEI